MRAETIRRIFLNYAALYRQYGTFEYYRQMQQYHKELIAAIKADLKTIHQ